MRLIILILALSAVAAGCAGVAPVEQRIPAVVEIEETGPPGRYAAELGIPPGHFPPPGQCRIWVPGRPPGHQERPGSCTALERHVPAGAWLLYRPGREVVRVSVCDAKRPGVIVAVRVYDSATGKYLRDEGR